MNLEKEKNESYQVTITNGEGSVQLSDGDFAATAEVKGYDNNSLQPASIKVTAGVTVYNFTIASTGTLTLHVSEDGTTTGTPVPGAVFKRCDKDGNAFGTEVTTDSTGNATFSNVPWSADGDVNVYYKQTATAEGHVFDNTLKTIALTEQTKTVEIQNKPLVTREIKLTDANYEGLPIETGTITLADA